jgi:hypothetical protein
MSDVRLWFDEYDTGSIVLPSLCVCHVREKKESTDEQQAFEALFGPQRLVPLQIFLCNFIAKSRVIYTAESLLAYCPRFMSAFPCNLQT